mgnify:CR=1 FL=1|jgi:hypothetical protein
MKSFKKIILSLLLGVFTLTLNSCIIAALAVGAGTVAYVNGEYSMNVEAKYKETYMAALKAVNDNDDYVLVSKSLDPANNTAEIEGATKVDSTNLSIDIKELTDNASKVTVKFGRFGDQAMSSTLMDQIQSNLNKRSFK